MGDTGSNLGSLTLAIADLKAIDARLTALAAADPPIESDGTDLTARILESQAQVRAAIALLVGARTSTGATNDAPDQSPGSAKLRVKIKAASETTAAGASAHAETSASSAPVASKASTASRSPAKAGSRSGDRARSVAASAAATAATPRNSLLARLGAAAAEPGASRGDVADRDGPTSAPAREPRDSAPLDAAERLARLEAEIDSLTEASTTGGRRSKVTASDAPTPPATAKTAEAPASARVAGTSAPVTTQSPGDGGMADDDIDAEIVIVTSDGKVSGADGRGTPQTRRDPRVFRDPPPGDDDDAEVEIVQPGADARVARVSMTPDGERAKSGVAKPAATAKWRLFRGSR